MSYARFLYKLPPEGGTLSHVVHTRVHSDLLSQVSDPDIREILLLGLPIWDGLLLNFDFKVRISFKAKKPFVQDKNYLLKYPPSNHLYFKNGCLGYKMIDVSLPKNSTGKFFEHSHLEHPLELSN